MTTDHQKLRVETDGNPKNTTLWLGDKQVGGLLSFDLHPIDKLSEDTPIATLVVYLEPGFWKLH